MQTHNSVRWGSIASVLARLVVATLVAAAAYVFGQLFILVILWALRGMIDHAGDASFILYLIFPVFIASVAGALTFYLLSRRLSRKKMPFHHTVPRYERRTCLGVTVPLFLCLLFIAPFALEAAGSRIWGSGFIGSGGSSETLSLILFLLFSFFLPYLAARVVYERLRWRQVASADPLCPNCLYNLTGNVSGRCPECGTPIDAGQGVDSAGPSLREEAGGDESP